MCNVLIGKEIIHGGSHCKVICPSMDNKLVEEVHGVDFRELNWHVQFFDIQRRCIVVVVGIVFSCLEIFH